MSGGVSAGGTAAAPLDQEVLDVYEGGANFLKLAWSDMVNLSRAKDAAIGLARKQDMTESY